MGAHGNVRVCPAGRGGRRSGHEPKILKVPDFHNLIYAMILVTGIGGVMTVHFVKLLRPSGSSKSNFQHQ